MKKVLIVCFLASFAFGESFMIDQRRSIEDYNETVAIVQGLLIKIKRPKKI